MQEGLAQLQDQSQAFLQAASKDILIPVLQSTYVLMPSIPIPLFWPPVVHLLSSQLHQAGEAFGDMRNPAAPASLLGHWPSSQILKLGVVSQLGTIP